MKSSILFLIGLFSLCFFSGQNLHAAMQEQIKTRLDRFKGTIEVQTEKYDDVRIYNIYFQHRQKEEKNGKKDYLYLKGSLKNLKKTILAGAYVTARFYDSDDNLIAIERKAIIPRIMRQHRKNRGRFTIKMPYDSRISLCKLEASW